MTEHKMAARDCAAKIIYSTVYDGGYANVLFNEIIGKARLSVPDRALCAEMVYGVLQNMALIDFYIANFSALKVNKISPMVMVILRMGVYQILFLDRVPNSAACDESVKLAKRYTNIKASGFVNGVLRNIERNKENLPKPDKSDKVTYLSIQYSVAPWIVRSWMKDYGENTAEQLCKCSLIKPRTVIRKNSLKKEPASFEQQIEGEGAEIAKIDGIDNAFYLHNHGDIAKMDSYRAGWFHVMGKASQLCVKIVNPSMEDIVVDTCAAPGGKTLMMAQMMENQGQIYAFDLYEKKMEFLAAQAKRLGIANIFPSLTDAQNPKTELFSKADKVLVDAPCSGLGILAKKPDIQFKKEKEIESLPKLQLAILQSSANYVKPGGELIYSTCTLKKAENEEVVERFLSEDDRFEPCDFQSLLPGQYQSACQNGMITLLPHTHNTDGFFIAKMRRKS